MIAVKDGRGSKGQMRKRSARAYETKTEGEEKECKDSYSMGFWKKDDDTGVVYIGAHLTSNGS